MAELGTYSMDCTVCGEEIVMPISAPGTFRKEEGSLSLVLNLDISPWETHAETHEGEAVFDD